MPSLYRASLMRGRMYIRHKILLRELRFINASHLFITGVRRTPFCLYIYDLVRINALDRLCPSRVPSSFCLRGDGESRTHDPLLARQVLSQLSYTPVCPDLVSGQAECRLNGPGLPFK